MFAYEFAKTIDRPGVPQGFITMSSGRGGRNPQFASPLSWTSFAGVRDSQNVAFKARLEELFLQYPDTPVARKAAAKHVAEVETFVRVIQESSKQGADASTFALQAPAFPEPGKGEAVPQDTIPTYAYNWCVSPLTPMGVAGVIWIPSEGNIGERPEDYAAEMEIYANSLSRTYDQKNIQFLYAQPAKSLVEGITVPDIPGAKTVTFDQWPKSMKGVAVKLAKLLQ